jgi:hypothetical protein
MKQNIDWSLHYDKRVSILGNLYVGIGVVLFWIIGKIDDLNWFLLEHYYKIRKIRYLKIADKFGYNIMRIK